LVWSPLLCGSIIWRAIVRCRRGTIRLENVTAQNVLEAVLANNNLILVKHARTNLVGITWK